jgi:hypothetical protein
MTSSSIELYSQTRPLPEELSSSPEPSRLQELSAVNFAHLEEELSRDALAIGRDLSDWEVIDLSAQSELKGSLHEVPLTTSGILSRTASTVGQYCRGLFHRVGRIFSFREEAPQEEIHLVQSAEALEPLREALSRGSLPRSLAKQWLDILQKTLPEHTILDLSLWEEAEIADWNPLETLAQLVRSPLRRRDHSPCMQALIPLWLRTEESGQQLVVIAAGGLEIALFDPLQRPLKELLEVPLAAGVHFQDLLVRLENALEEESLFDAECRMDRPSCILGNQTEQSFSPDRALSTVLSIGYIHRRISGSKHSDCIRHLAQSPRKDLFEQIWNRARYAYWDESRILTDSLAKVHSGEVPDISFISRETEPLCQGSTPWLMVGLDQPGSLLDFWSRPLVLEDRGLITSGAFHLEEGKILPQASHTIESELVRDASRDLAILIDGKALPFSGGTTDSCKESLGLLRGTLAERIGARATPRVIDQIFSMMHQAAATVATTILTNHFSDPVGAMYQIVACLEAGEFHQGLTSAQKAPSPSVEIVEDRIRIRRTHRFYWMNRSAPDSYAYGRKIQIQLEIDLLFSELPDFIEDGELNTSLIPSRLEFHPIMNEQPDSLERQEECVASSSS